MQQLAVIAFTLAVVAYSAAATLFFVDVARPGAGVAVRWAPRALAMAATIHVGHLVVGGARSGLGGFGTLPFALSASALITTLAYLFVRRRGGGGARAVWGSPR